LNLKEEITALSKSRSEEAIEELSEAVSMILSKNKTGYRVPQEIIDELDLDQLNEILTAYFDWLSKNKKDPN
jgi:CRISPR/Cas system-associated protein Cas7 (RAMP superfamily)